MSFLDNLKEEASFTETLNGAKTHASSGDACLDLFAVAGGMRHRSYRDHHLFDRAYIENPELAMKLLFYIRDIREGRGERELFRNLIRHTAKTWPESARKNIALISEYGRFDDLMCLMGTQSEKAVVELIRTQFPPARAAPPARPAGPPSKNKKKKILRKQKTNKNTHKKTKTKKLSKSEKQEISMHIFHFLPNGFLPSIPQVPVKEDRQKFSPLHLGWVPVSTASFFPRFVQILP